MTKNLETELIAALTEWADKLPHALAKPLVHAAQPPGKLLRPKFLMLSALANGYGGPLDVIARVGIAVELGHIASLIHDDIIDNDIMRRGRSSVQAEFGMPTAIVSGDLLIFSMFRDLARFLPGNVSAAAIEQIAIMGQELCIGQKTEELSSARGTANLYEYLKTCDNKTASYFKCMYKVGQLIAGGANAAVPTSEFASFFGIAFQICDDLLPLTSSDVLAGKTLDSDSNNQRITANCFLASNIDFIDEIDGFLQGKVTKEIVVSYKDGLEVGQDCQAKAQQLLTDIAVESRRRLALEISESSQYFNIMSRLVTHALFSRSTRGT